jgi:hypothetical protein
MNAILGHELPQRPQGGAESDEIPEDSTSWAIIQQCWNFAPDKRPTCLEILPLLRSAFEVHYPYHKRSQCVVTHTHFYSGLAFQYLENS